MIRAALLKGQLELTDADRVLGQYYDGCPPNIASRSTQRALTERLAFGRNHRRKHRQRTCEADSSAIWLAPLVVGDTHTRWHDCHYAALAVKAVDKPSSTTLIYLSSLPY